MEKINIPNMNTFGSNPPNFEVKNIAILTHNEMFEFQKETVKKQFEIAELQSKNADKQNRNNIVLTILALIFAFISIVPILREWKTPDKRDSERELLIHNQSKIISTLEKRISELEKKVDENKLIKTN